MTDAARIGRSGPNPDSRMLRGVRLRLIAWSAGSTLVVLAVLGTVLYLAAAQTLVSQSTRTLEDRIDAMRPKVVAEAQEEAAGKTMPQVTPSAGPTMTSEPSVAPPASPAVEPSGNSDAASQVNLTGDASQPGLVIGGPSSGTIAFALDPDSHIAVKLSPPTTAGGPAVLDIPEPDQSLQDAARGGRTVVWEDDLRGTPVRFVLKGVQTDLGLVLIESMGDRTSEIALLRSLLAVLLAGSLAAIAAAAAFGYFYAGRALVPIRSSLQRQRDFAADASHELRTPLAIVRGAVHELRAGDGEGGDRERSIADIEAGANRLSQLVDDLLLLARADSGILELRRDAVDLSEVATDAVAGLARQAANRSVRLHLDVVPASVRGDAERLAQVVAILVDNAIKHSPDGGSVSVLVRDGVELAVEDEGPGIRASDLPRLFDRFWRAADAPPDGVGLGLSIAAWIVESHGGTISAANREGGGARFEVKIPALRR